MASAGFICRGSWQLYFVVILKVSDFFSISEMYMAKSSFDLLPDATLETSLPTTDENIWDGLKQAIALSSGFQRWQNEHKFDSDVCQINLDSQVRRYLRETLETLAY